MLDFTELPADGIKFEQLIRELFVRSDFDVHWTGVGPDGGRDLVVIEKAAGPLATFERTWLVSCKHYGHSGKSVGLEDINGVTDACRAVNATGFLLACSTQPSSSVVRRLEEIRSNAGIVTKCWDSIEVERRLDTPATFPLISLFFPVSARERPWRIYNTETPSFWAANYKEYFLYLGSRTANTFPSLSEVEFIVAKLESIVLPAGSDWSEHIIRPRAVYFDNKHENFSVFADYLFPEGRRRDAVKPAAINRVLRDGHGLHADDQGGSWYTTFWDVRYVPSAQISDHFHLDHKKFYEPYLNNYKVGMARSEFLGELVQIS